MRIGLSCTTIEPALTKGKIDGIGMYTKHLYDELSKRGKHVIPCSFSNSKNLTTSDLQNGKLFGFSYTSSTMLSLLNTFTLHKKIEKHIDLYHSTDHMIPKFSNIPIVATLNDALMLKHPEWYNPKFRYIKNWLRKKTMAWVTHCITISHAMVPEIVEFWGIKEDKISVVYDGISSEWFEEIPKEKRYPVLKKFKLPEKFLLFAGTLQPKKNISRLIQAYLQLPNDIKDEFPLVIVGKAGWNTEESLAAINKLLKQQRGFWLDYVSTEDLRALFQSTTLFLYPSLHEGFGLPLLEAFASKTPVLTSNIPALQETANGAAYLIDPYSVEGMKTAIKTLLTNSSLRHELIQKGTDRVKEFSWERSVKETLEVYKKLI